MDVKFTQHTPFSSLTERDRLSFIMTVMAASMQAVSSYEGKGHSDEVLAQMIATTHTTCISACLLLLTGDADTAKQAFEMTDQALGGDLSSFMVATYTQNDTGEA